MLPAFVEVARLRPVAIVGRRTTSFAAPYTAIETELAAPDAALTLTSGSDLLRVRLEGDAVALDVTSAGTTTTHRSRRHGRTQRVPQRLALALTGNQLTALTHEQGRWIARGKVDLYERIDTHDPLWLTGLAADAAGAGVGNVAVGEFGQLGLRDLRVVTQRDGTPYRPSGRLLLSATSAGPGFFATAHTSLWTLDPAGAVLEHLSDVYFARDGKVYGDHATHVVRDGDRWLVATSTWGSFRHHDNEQVDVVLAETDVDLLTGSHVLATRPLPMPTDGLASVGTWDPHLVHTGDEWLVGFVSARRFFAFHPAVAAGPTLDDLRLLDAPTGRRATEGTTLLRHDSRWLALASDGRDNKRSLRRRYPAWEVTKTGLDAREGLVAPYPTNIPWPTLVQPSADGEPWWLVTFDGTPQGGPLTGYGTHGDVVLMRENQGLAAGRS